MEDKKRKKVEFDGSALEEQNNVLDFCEQCELYFLELYNTYCIGAKKENIPDIIDSFWNDIYIKVFKPEKKLVNNQKSKLIYSDVETIEKVTRLYINLCRRYGGVVKINTFCEFTGISKETMNIWNNGKHISNYIVSLNNKDIENEKEKIIYIHDRDFSTDGYNNIKPNYYINELQKNNSNNSTVDNKSTFLRFDCKKILIESMQGNVRNGLSSSPVGHLARANNDDEIGLLWDAKRQLTSAAINGRAVLTAAELPKLGEMKTDSNIIDV